MPKVELAKAVRLKAGHPLSLAGDVVEVDDATYERLAPLGVFRETDDAPEVDTAVEVEPSVDPSVEDEPAPTPTRSGRPMKDATISEWRDYAKTQHDMSVSGLKKAEIIGAVLEAEGE